MRRRSMSRQRIGINICGKLVIDFDRALAGLAILFGNKKYSKIAGAHNASHRKQVRPGSRLLQLVIEYKK